jgi:hypothetical protein
VPWQPALRPAFMKLSAGKPPGPRPRRELRPPLVLSPKGKGLAGHTMVADKRRSFDQIEMGFESQRTRSSSPDCSPVGPAKPCDASDGEIMDLNDSFPVPSSSSFAGSSKFCSPLGGAAPPDSLAPAFSTLPFNDFVLAAQVAHAKMQDKVVGVEGSLRDHEVALVHHETVLREASGREADFAAGVHDAFGAVHRSVGDLHTQLRRVGGHIQSSVATGIDELREDLQGQLSILEEGLAEDQESLEAAIQDCREEGHARVEVLIKSLDLHVPLLVNSSVQQALDGKAFVLPSTLTQSLDAGLLQTQQLLQSFREQHRLDLENLRSIFEEKMLRQAQISESRESDFRRLDAARGEQAAYLTRLEVQCADLAKTLDLTQSAFAALGRTQAGDMSSLRHDLLVLESSARGTQSALVATEVKMTSGATNREGELELRLRAVHDHGHLEHQRQLQVQVRAFEELQRDQQHRHQQHQQQSLQVFESFAHEHRNIQAAQEAQVHHLSTELAGLVQSVGARGVATPRPLVQAHVSPRLFFKLPGRVCFHFGTAPGPGR